MFESGRFATPYFIHYGMDGQAPDIDYAQKYIYVISNNGFWSNGDDYILDDPDGNGKNDTTGMTISQIQSIQK